MIKQKIFKYKFNKKNTDSDFYVNETNFDAYQNIHNINYNNIYLKGPIKSGKSFLADIWVKQNNALLYKDNFEVLLSRKRNIYIDNINKYFDEESLFHILNHCKFHNLHILITSRYEINEINFKLNDLISRLKVFTYLKIQQPDDDMLINILTKLFIERQFVINSQEIFMFILKNTNRSYENIINVVNRLDKLSLEKKRQLTIPLIKEIL